MADIYIIGQASWHINFIGIIIKKVGIANVNLSKIKTGRANAIRFSTLEAICDVLDCQPGDILEFKRDRK